MNTLNRDRNILKRLVESYGKEDVANFVRHLNENQINDPSFEIAFNKFVEEYSNSVHCIISRTDLYFLKRSAYNLWLASKGKDNLQNDDILAGQDKFTIINDIINNSEYIKSKECQNITSYCKGRKKNALIRKMVENWVSRWLGVDFSSECYDIIDDWKDELSNLIDNLATCKKVYALYLTAVDEFYNTIYNNEKSNKIISFNIGHRNYSVEEFQFNNFKGYVFSNGKDISAYLGID